MDCKSLYSYNAIKYNEITYDWTQDGQVVQLGVCSSGTTEDNTFTFSMEKAFHFDYDFKYINSATNECQSGPL